MKVMSLVGVLFLLAAPASADDGEAECAAMIHRLAKSGYDTRAVMSIGNTCYQEAGRKRARRIEAEYAAKGQAVVCMGYRFTFCLPKKK